MLSKSEVTPRRLFLLSRACAFLACVFGASLALPRVAHADDDGAWKLIAQKRGMRLEKRKVAGTSFPELRISTHSPLPVATLAAAAWADRYDGKLTKKSRILREVLSEVGDERTQYNQIRVPIVSDRDYTLHLRRRYGTDGVFHLEIQSITGRPPQKGFVRIPETHSKWTISPAADGGCDVVYVTYAEPGGGVPAWAVKGAQLESAMEVVEEVLDWANRHPVFASTKTP